jgi:hypothetical protein
MRIAGETRKMKWSEFEAQYTNDLYTKAKRLCEEHHNHVMSKGGFTSRFCNHCYEREGWKCFPCKDIKEMYEKRYGEPLLEDSMGRKKK